MDFFLKKYKLMSSGYYFSYTYNLTLSKIKMAYGSETNSYFLWNGNMFQDLISQKIDKNWIVPLIQVYELFFLKEI